MRKSPPAFRANLAVRMMRREIFQCTMLVLMAILALFILFDAIDASNIKRINELGWSVQTLQILLEVPSRTYELLPLAVLMGCIWALSLFARSNELTVLRVSGMTVRQLLKVVAGFGLMMGCFGVMIDEVIDPLLQQSLNPVINRLTNAKAQPNKEERDVWLRYGNNMIHLDSLQAGNIRGLTIIEISPNFDRVERITQAQSARVVDDENASQMGQSATESWELEKGWTRTLPSSTHPEQALQSLLTLNNLPAERDQWKPFAKQTWHEAPATKFFVRQNTWNGKDKIYALWPRYWFNQANNLNNKATAIALWKKMFYPLMLVVMAMTGLPFCLQTGRNVETNLRLLIGIVMGIVFFVLQGLFSNLGILALPPIPSIAAPLILFASLTFFGIWWAQRR